MAQTTRPPAGLPRRLTLVIIQVIGIALVVVGFHALIHGAVFLGKPFGLLLVLTGVNLLNDPTARHDELHRLLSKLLDRWRSPPVP